ASRARLRHRDRIDRDLARALGLSRAHRRCIDRRGRADGGDRILASRLAERNLAPPAFLSSARVRACRVSRLRASPGHARRIEAGQEGRGQMTDDDDKSGRIRTRPLDESVKLKEALLAELSKLKTSVVLIVA